MYAIGQYETGWKHTAKGKSGESGALQFLPTTWKSWCKEVLGYEDTMTPENEKYVAARMIDRFLDNGFDEKQIILIWNSGQSKVCSSGFNSKGVWYDSCDYVKKVLQILTKKS